MTLEKQEAVFGRLMREKRDAERLQASLRAEIYRIGDSLVFIGKTMRSDLVNLRLQQTHVDDFAAIGGLLEEYRGACEKLQSLAEQLNGF